MMFIIIQKETGFMDGCYGSPKSAERSLKVNAKSNNRDNPAKHSACRVTLKEEILMCISQEASNRLYEIDKKLYPLFIEGAQLVLNEDGLELVQYGTGEDDPENDQGWTFYTRRIDTKEVAEAGVNIEEIVEDLLMEFGELEVPDWNKTVA